MANAEAHRPASRARRISLAIFLAIAVLVIVGVGRRRYIEGKAREQLALGVPTFRSLRYSEAESHFREAVRLNPAFTTARLYLALTYLEEGSPVTFKNSMPPEINSRKC